jgi:hypothetical protein
MHNKTSYLYYFLNIQMDFERQNVNKLHQNIGNFPV